MTIFLNSELEHLLPLNEKILPRGCMVDFKGEDWVKEIMLRGFPKCDDNEPLPSGKVQISFNAEPLKDINIGLGRLKVNLCNRILMNKSLVITIQVIPT